MLIWNNKEIPLYLTDNEEKLLDKQKEIFNKLVKEELSGVIVRDGKNKLL